MVDINSYNYYYRHHYNYLLRTTSLVLLLIFVQPSGCSGGYLELCRVFESAVLGIVRASKFIYQH